MGDKETTKENPLLYGEEKLVNTVTGAGDYISAYTEERMFDIEDVKLRTLLPGMLYSYAKRVVDTDILEKELAEANNKHLRLYADFDNFRKRTAKEKTEILTNAGESVIKSILPTLDNFERAILVTDDEGVKLVYNGLVKVLEAKGVKIMDCMGADFTPELHEAITQIPTEGMKGKIVDILEKGYLLNDKVIRYAKVVVGS